MLRELITARTVSAFRRLLCCAIVSSVLVTITACAPALRPLKGAPAPSVVPRAVLPAGYHQIVFDWELQDRELVGRGEGVARIASPDSVRLDLFLRGGFGSGVAVLIDDSLQVPGGSIVRGLIPPAPLLWAALGRAAVPAFHDTTARVDGELLRVDIGVPPSWRLTFRGDSLLRLERVRGGRIIEWVERAGSVVRYRSEEARRALSLTIKRVQEVQPFEASIWDPF